MTPKKIIFNIKLFSGAPENIKYVFNVFLGDRFILPADKNIIFFKAAFDNAAKCFLY